MPIPRLLSTASFRLSTLYGAVTIFCFAILLGVTYWTATAALREQLRVEVLNDLQSLAAESDADGVGTIVQDINERTLASSRIGGYYFLSNKDGLKLAGNLDAIPPGEGWQELAFERVAANLVTAPADEDHELWGQGKRLADGSFLFVAQDAFRVLSAQEAIIHSFLWSAGAAIVLAGFAGLVLSRGFLRQIDAINATSQAIMDGEITQRIPVRGTSDEIGRLSMNLNRLFDSNHSLLESLKQVSANIAHDLRTPLGRLRQGLEELKSKPAGSSAHDGAVDAAIAEADQLLATFSALLRIAQIESGTRKSAFKVVDLTQVFERVASAYSAVAEDDGKTFTAEIAPGLDFRGDSDLLLQMVANLLENAIRHTPPQSRIWLTLRPWQNGAVAFVADSGLGIPSAERGKVFERFYRLDASRTTAGNGLGLALVAAVADLHGIGLSLADNQPGLKVVLNFPGFT